MPLDDDQHRVCDRYGIAFCAAAPSFMVAISSNAQSGLQPLNGLRHPVESDMTGWWLWAGEEWSEAPEFWLTLHVEHLAEWLPAVLPYLGLPPGWRFIIADSHEDVWYDPALLQGF